MIDKIILPFDTTLLEILEDMVFISKVEQDLTFTYAYFNHLAIHHANVDRDGIGKTFGELHDAELSAFLNNQYSSVLRTKKVITYEDSYHSSSSGVKKYSNTRLTPLFDLTGECTYIIGVVKDITNEKLAQLDSEISWNKLVESQSRYRSLFENNTDAVFTTDLSGVILSGNPAVEKISGYSLDEMKGKLLVEFIDTSESSYASKSFQQALEEGKHNYRTNLLGKSGVHISCLVNFTPIEVKGEVVGVYAILKDVRELDDMSNKVVESEKHFRIIAENAQDVIVLINDKLEYIYVSPSTNEVYGFNSFEYIGKPAIWHVHPEDMPRLELNFTQALLEAKTSSFRLRIKHKTDGWLWSELKVTPVYSKRNNFKHMVMIIRDVTLQKKNEDQLEYFAYHDFLTDLPNRRFFTDRLQTKLDQGNSFAVCLLDIDHFKNINDQFGHEVGDSVIREFGRRLSENISKDAMVARLGGDEFVLLLPNVGTEEHAKEIAMAVKATMEMPWSMMHKMLNVTTSMGISLISSTEATVTSVLKAADDAMYDAKKSGRNCFHIVHSA